MTLLDPNKSLMKKFITPFLIVITSIILSSCLEGKNPKNPTKTLSPGSEYAPPREGYVPKEEKKKKERDEKEKLERELDAKKKSQESFLDDAIEDLNRLNFGNNNENKFDDTNDPNKYIFQSPQSPNTPDTPSMPETFSYPETYDYGSEF